MKQYHDLIKYILDTGIEKKNRTKISTISIFGYQMIFDLKKGFPLLTTKKLHIKSIIHELLWFIKGETNIKYLNKHGVKIWNEWANKNGDLGPIYGKQWRNWSGIDQLSNLIKEIQLNPNSRRLIISSWNVNELENMVIPPCHAFFQFYVSNKELSLQLYQRSGDVFLGIPFNIASYSLLLIMIAQVTKLRPNKFIHTLGDAHIYKNHLNQVNIQLNRKPKILPKIILNKTVKSIFEFKYEDFKIKNYVPYPAIKGDVSI